ncbi:MAG: phosphoglycerate kinase [Actinomycetota bacterium]
MIHGGASTLPRIEDLDVEGRRVLVRCDLNVPLSNGRIEDDLRIRASLPTLRELLERGGRLAICSHLGRPKGKVVEDLRLAPVGRRLGELLERDVMILEDIAGERARAACSSEAAVVLLENLRFDPGEEANEAGFAGALAALADAYVNDAFGASHRAHASIVGVPERAAAIAAGVLLTEEVERLGRLLQAPEEPFVAVLGGVKVSDKLGVLDHLLSRVQSICVGGAMAFTLLAAQGEDVGRSLVERDRIGEVGEVLDRARDNGVDVLLPTDVVVADEPREDSDHSTVDLSDIGDRMGVDIGPGSSEVFSHAISNARTVVWNGPMGIFEIEAFSHGTRAVAKAIAAATRAGAYTVAGGGDSAAALAALDLTDAVVHLSTGGGASLEFLEGKDLPGVAVLRRRGST